MEPIDLSVCEARIDGIYYNQFEAAFSDAKIRADKPKIILMNDIVIESTLEIGAKEEFAIQGEKSVKKITKAGEATQNLIHVTGGGTLNLQVGTVNGDLKVYAEAEGLRMAVLNIKV